jgi:phytoene dehydrogenase-like protein
MTGGADFDDLVIGAGMAGLTVGALLAAEGRRVLMLEAHDTPGGYAHTFEMGEYRFCAQVHYIFGCGEGEAIHELLTRVGLADDVRFERLDPEGFDHIVVAGDRVRVCNGLEKYRERLVKQFPAHERPIRRYFDAVLAIGREVDAIPKQIGARDVLTAPFRFGHLIRYRQWTLQRLFDDVGMPPRLQTILAGQSGDHLLPPERVSLLLHVALVRAYDRGAYYPEKHFRHFIGSLAETIANRPGCRLVLRTEVERILVDSGRVTGARTKAGETFTARRYISNVDPRRTAELVGRSALPKRWLDRLEYAYSASAITLYLGVRGIDLREHGFGSWNVWHYPQDDINAIYRRQHEQSDLDDPWLFMSTPTLHTSAPGLCPPGDQILELVTGAPYAHFAELRERDRKRYNLEKKRLRERMMSVVEERFVPNLSKHVVMRVMGTPATNARFCFAPEGNAYGAELTPANVRWSRLAAETPLENLWLVNATAGYPSIGGTVAAGLALFGKLQHA